MKPSTVLFRVLALSAILLSIRPPQAAAQANKGTIIVDPVSGLVTTESGDQAEFTIVLDRAPRTAVKVGISSSDLSEATVSPTSVTFNVLNWAIPQRIRVTGVDDALTDGDIAYSLITDPAISSDNSFDGVNALDVTATNWDNEGGPVANPDEVVTAEGQPVTINVLANDAALNLPPFQVTTPDKPAHGTVAVNPNNTLTYQPASGFTGADGLAYRVCDARVRCSQASVTITVNPLNRPPLAVNDSYSVAQDTALQVSAPGVLVNDTDPNGDQLTAVLVLAPANGSLALDENGSFVYVPNPGYVGLDLFNYQARDGKANSNTAAVAIQVTDTIPPTVEWIQPIVNDQVYLVGKEVIELGVTASDNAGVARVLFNRWDPNLLDYRDIGEATQAPFSVSLDTSVLAGGWNQIFARAYDADGNASERQFIWLYKSIRLYLPIITRR